MLVSLSIRFFLFPARLPFDSHLFSFFVHGAFREIRMCLHVPNWKRYGRNQWNIVIMLCETFCSAQNHLLCIRMRPRDTPATIIQTKSSQYVCGTRFGIIYEKTAKTCILGVSWTGFIVSDRRTFRFGPCMSGYENLFAICENLIFKINGRISIRKAADVICGPRRGNKWPAFEDLYWQNGYYRAEREPYRNRYQSTDSIPWLAIMERESQGGTANDTQQS